MTNSVAFFLSYFGSLGILLLTVAWIYGRKNINQSPLSDGLTVALIEKEGEKKDTIFHTGLPDLYSQAFGRKPIAFFNFPALFTISILSYVSISSIFFIWVDAYSGPEEIFSLEHLISLFAFFGVFAAPINFIIHFIAFLQTRITIDILARTKSPELSALIALADLALKGVIFTGIFVGFRATTFWGESAEASLAALAEILSNPDQWETYWHGGPTMIPSLYWAAAFYSTFIFSAWIVLHLMAVIITKFLYQSRFSLLNVSRDSLTKHPFKVLGVVIQVILALTFLVGFFLIQ